MGDIFTSIYFEPQPVYNTYKKYTQLNGYETVSFFIDDWLIFMFDRVILVFSIIFPTFLKIFIAFAAFLVFLVVIDYLIMIALFYYVSWVGPFVILVIDIYKTC